jgi:uncharacterized protein (TIGR00251 family)
MCARLAIYVTPKSSHDEIAGWRGDELSVRITAAPADGKANAAVCKLIASEVGVAKSAVQVVRGQTARHKLLEIQGVADEALVAVWGRPGTVR